MAKRTDEGLNVAAEEGNEHPSGRTAEETIGDFAADLGRILGTAQAKASAWMDQRKAITDQLTQIRDTANQYLHQLTGEAATLAATVTRGRRGRPPGRARKAGPGRRKGSGKTKGAKRAGKRKGGGMSPEGRARVAAAQKARWAAKRKAEAGSA